MRKYRIGCIVLIMFILFTCSACAFGKAKQYNDQYDIGEKYLADFKYEEAIESFSAAIEIDENNPDAYIGRAEAYAMLGQLEEAIEDYTAAQEKGADVETMLSALTDGYDLLYELKGYCEAENYDAIFANLADNSYKDIVAKLLDQSVVARLIDSDSGIMTAMFETSVNTNGFEDSVYMVYYGNQQNGIRDGNGIWLGYNNGNNYFSEGKWLNDKPNGNFSSRSWQAQLDEEVVYRVISGKVVDGLWDGAVSWGFERGNGNNESWRPTFNKGKWQVIREEVIDGNTVYIVDASGDLVVTDTESVEGIAGFANNA